MRCVESIKFAVLVDETPRNFFRPSRGLRQGDPLSPYLFLLCAEGLSARLTKEESLSNFSGLKISKFGPLISHVFFADDNLFFFKDFERDCQSLRMVFKDYEDASRQAINRSKSMFITSKNVSPGKRKAIEV